MKIGFIGQGFIGKHMADDFVERGYEVVRYALEAEYVGNRAAIADCDIVFIAVPTPTRPSGFDSSILEGVMTLVGAGKIAVIKSTILPGTTRRLQATFPNITILHAPEFLREKQAATDTRQPARTIIGYPLESKVHLEAARQVLAVLPAAPYVSLCRADEAELIKYAGNTFLALKVVFMNLVYDAAQASGVNYEVIASAMAADNRIGSSHMRVIDQSGHPGSMPGRGAGGHCFPKDLAALRAHYASVVPDDALGQAVLTAFENKNRQLLRDSHKDLDLIREIYG